MMKKIMLLLLCSLTVILTSVTYAASNVSFDTPIDVTVNDHFIKMDSEPYLHEGTTFVPIRFISEALGANVEWNMLTRTAIITDTNTTIKLPIWKTGGYVNQAYVAIDEGIMLVNDRTYVPVRFVAENMGATVVWDKETYTVKVSKSGVTVPQSLITTRAYTNDDIYWLSHIIGAESASEPMAGKIAVGNVILNRVKSKEYPNTIYGVIFDKQYGVQFEPTLNGTINNTPSGDSVIAAKRALRGENVVGDCLYFLNPTIAQSFWIVNNREYYTTIGRHEFYL